MISKLARDDFEELRAQGLEPTLDDFDRLNQIALRITEGAETTCANFPRVGWAGDVPFYQPTIAAFAWYHGHAARLAADDETANTFWFFALAHGREPGLLSSLHDRDAIERAVKEWAEALTVTRDEVARACRYAAVGFDDAKAAGPAQDAAGSPLFRADRSEAAKNLRRIEAQLVAACVALKCPPDALMGETQTRLDAMCEAAAVELGRGMKRDEAKLRAAYDLTLREIALRLKGESDHGKDERNDDENGGDGVGDHVPPIAGTEPSRRVSDEASGEEPEEAVVVVHGEKDSKTGDGGQE